MRPDDTERAVAAGIWRQKRQEWALRATLGAVVAMVLIFALGQCAGH